MAIHAVIFDMGGVVLDSALPVLHEYERSHDLPNDFILDVVGKGSSRANGPVTRMWKGEITLDEFCRLFDEEFASRGHRISTAEIMLEMTRNMHRRPVVVSAIERLRSNGIKTAALTNVWKSEALHFDEEDTSHDIFDVYLASCEIGMQKPDIKLLEHACEELETTPGEIAYLEEIGTYLKPAAKLGMTTIKVVDAEAALAELAGLVGFTLTDPRPNDDPEPDPDSLTGEGPDAETRELPPKGDVN